MSENPLKQGALTENSSGIGTVTRGMVRRRAVELAIINGHPSQDASITDWEQAKRELTGEPEADPQQTILESAPESERWDIKRPRPPVTTRMRMAEATAPGFFVAVAAEESQAAPKAQAMITQEDATKAGDCDTFSPETLSPRRTQRQLAPLSQQITTQSLMSANIESIHPWKERNARALKPIARSAIARLGTAVAAVGLLVAIPCAMAAPKLSTRDRDFFRAAAQSGMAVVKLGELASRHGMRDGVRNLGRMIAADQSTINRRLKALAAKKGMTLPDSLDAEHQKWVAQTAASTDSDFDDGYTTVTSKVLKAEIREFKAGAVKTRDPDIKRFVDHSSSTVIEYSLRVDVMRR